MKTNELRNKTTEELNNLIDETKSELFNLRLSSATGMIEKPHRIRELRHLVARCKTIIREREEEKGAVE